MKKEEYKPVKTKTIKGRFKAFSVSEYEDFTVKIDASLTDPTDILKQTSAFLQIKHSLKGVWAITITER